MPPRMAQLSPRRARKPGGYLIMLLMARALPCPTPVETDNQKRFVLCRTSLKMPNVMALNIESLHIGMRVRHPQYGVGVVRSLTEHTAEIAFDDAPRTIAPASSDLQPGEPTASVSELQVPLANLIRDTASATVEALGLEKKDALVEGLANRWQNGTLLMQPEDSSLQPKEVPLETFFHKIVMIRNNLRVLEQKVNASEELTDADKVELQQYITRCYGSLTTFNILFNNNDDQFRSGSEADP